MRRDVLADTAVLFVLSAGAASASWFVLHFGLHLGDGLRWIGLDFAIVLVCSLAASWLVFGTRPSLATTGYSAAGLALTVGVALVGSIPGIIESEVGFSVMSLGTIALLVAGALFAVLAAFGRLRPPRTRRDMVIAALVLLVLLAFAAWLVWASDYESRLATDFSPDALEPEYVGAYLQGWVIVVMPFASLLTSAAIALGTALRARILSAPA